MSTPSPPSSPNPNSTPFIPATSTVVALVATSAATATATATTKKPQPILWSHEETLHLIQTYKDKWFSLKRGQLKASHWEEIAVAVSARSGVDRSATQCRHKIEKLRKRFRSERQGAGQNSPWPYYGLMDELDRGGGGGPISARPITRVPPVKVNYNESDEDDGNDDENRENEDDDDDGDDEERCNKSRSINYILRRPSVVNRFAGSGNVSGGGDINYEDGLYAEFVQAAKRRRVGEEGRRVGTELVAEVRGFAERIMVIERRKMEMVRETERRRMEMEKKRIQMIQNSQRKVVDLIAKAFGSLPENLKA